MPYSVLHVHRLQRNLLKKFLILNPSKRRPQGEQPETVWPGPGSQGNLQAEFLPLCPSPSLCSPANHERSVDEYVGHEDDELKPYVEPLPDYKDPRRTGEAVCWSVRLSLPGTQDLP